VFSILGELFLLPASLCFALRLFRHQPLQRAQVPPAGVAGRDPVANDLALHNLDEPVLDEEIALYVKLGVPIERDTGGLLK
jgi:hypothetical protein